MKELIRQFEKIANMSMYPGESVEIKTDKNVTKLRYIDASRGIDKVEIYYGDSAISVIWQLCNALRILRFTRKEGR